ncbi:MAG: TonB family protein [Deltaproteobacteria bacterium]|nr:TonB family protein [Deltaproteobacteria bacterium]
MDSKKIFLLPIIISIIGHVALITVSSMVDLRDNVKAAELFTVRIAQSEPQRAEEPAKEEKAKPVREKVQPQKKEAKPIPEGGREDTVDLGSSDMKYAGYLATLKKKILPIWISAEAYRKSEVGVVVILMSINADGSLAQLLLTSSSGSASLDQGTLDVINAAAPFGPLPAKYELSRLHITASFRYQ